MVSRRRFGDCDARMFDLYRVDEMGRSTDGLVLDIRCGRDFVLL